MNKSSEEDILNKIKRQDKDGIKQLFDQYHQSLCVFALKYLDSFSEAEDVVQDCFIHLWEKDHIKSVNISIKSYLYTSVQNRCLRRLENNKKVRIESIELLADELMQEQRDTSTFEERKKMLHQELEKLPAKSREVVEHIVFHGMKYKEAAEELNISVNTVKTQFARALKQLRGSINLIIYFMY